AVFTMTLSMAVLLPARADSIPPPGTPPTQFSVSGPAADQIQYQIFADESGEFNALQAGQIDLTDTPAPGTIVDIACPTGTNFWCTGVAPNPPEAWGIFVYVKGWTGVSDATGIGIATGNVFSLMNAWNLSPAISGPTIRWGMKQGTSILNPFLSTLASEQNVLQEIYEHLLTVTPYIPGTAAQIIGY